MAHTINNESRAVKPSRADSKLALDSSRKLASCLKAKRKSSLRFQIEPEDGSAGPISIPAPALRLLASILSEMGQGNAVVLIPEQTELTTQQAAEVLGVSRPFIVEQMEKNLLPHRKVGSHRRVLFSDLMAYKEQMNQNRFAALEELSELDQKNGMGY